MTETHHPAMPGPPSAPFDVADVSARLRLLNTASIAPYGLDLDFAETVLFPPEPATSQVHYSQILDELRLWGRLLIHRPLSLIRIRSPFRVLDDSEFTELVHVIAQSFRVLTAEHAEHAVTLREQDLTPQNLGLVTGLHFNHFLLEVDSRTTLGSARSGIRKLRRLKVSGGYRELYASLDFQPCWPAGRLQAELPGWMADLAPETVVFRNNCTWLSTFAAGTLHDSLYRFVPPDRLARFPLSLNTPPADLVCPGPGRCSHLGGLRVLSHTRLPVWQAALERGELPVSICESDHPVTGSLWSSQSL